MTVAMPPRTRLLADTVWTTLSALGGITDGQPWGVLAWRGQIVDADGAPTEPPLDTDGRVHPHALVYFEAGTGETLRASGVADRLAWGFQVTCVGGDDERALYAADTVRGALRSLWVGGSLLTETPGAPVLDIASDITPGRCWVPLIFTCHPTTE